ncbi:metallophosphoesterase [Anaerotalea alkaliphila]|uniref:Metallophosphoesterase n=1 Tax=Anaerotalea alkaliphila TaxID=2662126 RepID=A0A7X5HTN8_9FIRM|nr:metallophosphoesterase [Anaerotalea alkaliphila]NDL66477.1 metallophosphoesterase [Anaerotalea alkaliphila]
MRRPAVSNKRPVLAVSLLVFLVLALWHGPVTRRHVVETDSPHIKSPVRIVLVTDLHSHIYGTGQGKLLERIAREEPDLLVLAGDIADDVAPDLGTVLFLEGIKGMAPTFYVTGNHEWWRPDVEAVKDLFASHGVRVLSQETATLKVGESLLGISGIEDLEILRLGKGTDPDSLQELMAPLAKRPMEGYQILAAHRPEGIRTYRGYGFDLVLSGHAHGGQWRIPLLLNGLYAPNQGFLPPYAGGIYRHGTTTHVVSRGLAFNPRLPRIFNPAEVVLVELVPVP